MPIGCAVLIGITGKGEYMYSTLTWRSDNACLAIGVSFDRWDYNRVQLEWVVTLIDPAADGPQSWHGSDLSIPLPDGIDTVPYAAALRSLSSFLGAWVESCEAHGCAGENANLFPTSMWEAAASAWSTWADEFAMAMGDA